MKLAKYLCLCSIMLSLGGCTFMTSSSGDSLSTSSSVTTGDSVNTTSSSFIGNSSSNKTSNSTASDISIDGSSISSSNVSSGIVSSSSTSSTVTETDIEYETFFDLNTRIEITIKMTQDELTKLNNDYYHYQYNGGKSPLSRVADVEIKFDDKVYSYTQVGIKMKGNTSRTSFLDNDGNINNLIHYKLDFSDTFGDTYYDGSTYTLDTSKAERKERRFLGMEKIDLKWNRNYDATHIKQVYAYQMFNDFGLMALNMNIGKVNLQIDNQTPKSLGIFEVAEVVDDIFLERRLPAAELGGDLYKVCYTIMGKGDLTNNNLDSVIGVEDEETSYFPIYDLKTNKKTSNHALLKDMIYYLNSNNVTKDGLAEYVNMDNFLMEEAVAYVLGNPDDMRNNYNNYYLYFGQQSQKAYIIPYDWDRCLGITTDWNPTGDALINTKHNSNWAQGAQTNQSNPLVRYTLGREEIVIQEYNNQFTNNIKTVFESKWTNPEYFDYLFNIAKSNYQNECFPEFSQISRKGINFENQANGVDHNMSFNDYMSSKRSLFYSIIGETDPGASNF